MKSIEKAVRVLRCFRAERPELGVTEISFMTGLPKSVVHNILAAFRKEDIVEQDRQTRKYRLSLEILRLSNVVREGLGLRKVALPLMEKVKELHQETCHLAIAQDGYVVYIESLQPRDRSVTRLATGKRACMHCTGVGKAILAYAPGEEVDQIIARRGLPAYTPNTITAVHALKAELEAIRLRGYAVDNMEHEWGIRCVAAPIRDEEGRVGASMSLSGPSERFSAESIPRMAHSLMAAALEISRRLGWQWS